jgi:hypothetical protein
LITDNSPAILTAIGVTGTLSTAYLTGKASFKAGDILAREQRLRSQTIDIAPILETKEKVQLVWKLYIPAAGSAVMTTAAIVCANRISTRRAAAMAAAYSISEKAWNEYKDKVVEKLGANKERAVRDEIAQDRVNSNPVGVNQVIITGGGDVLCYDMYTGRYFTSDMETLKKAQNDTNYEVLNNFYCSLTEFYNRIGLSSTTTSDDVGWNSDEMLELTFSTTMSDDQRPCLAMSFAVEPIRNFHRAH